MTMSPAEFMSAAPKTSVSGSSPWAALSLPSGHVALVDEDDMPLVEQFRWHALVSRRTVYVQTKGNAANSRQRTYLHRLLMRAETGQLVDHRNHNGLDNRRENLRICTAGQNQVNRVPMGSTGYRGVAHHPNHKTKPWRARLEGLHIGYFETAWEAAQAYNEAALEKYGEFVLLNVRQP